MLMNYSDLLPIFRVFFFSIFEFLFLFHVNVHPFIHLDKSCINSKSTIKLVEDGSNHEEPMKVEKKNQFESYLDTSQEKRMAILMTHSMELDLKHKKLHKSENCFPSPPPSLNSQEEKERRGWVKS